jgi:hypothetical protein
MTTQSTSEQLRVRAHQCEVKAELDDRLAAAFADGATEDTVAALIEEPSSSCVPLTK